jgi:hypothetical protein
MHIPLSEWAGRNFSPTPCATTLCKWAKSGAITPKPFKLRKWMVDENARFVGEQAIPVSGRVADILKMAA